MNLKLTFLLSLFLTLLSLNDVFAQKEIASCSGNCTSINVGDTNNSVNTPYYMTYFITDEGVSNDAESFLDLLPTNYPHVEEFCINGRAAICPNTSLVIEVHINDELTLSKTYSTVGTNFYFKFEAEERDIVSIQIQTVDLNNGIVCKRFGEADITICHD